MSTFTEINGLKTTPLDGPNDLKPKVKTSYIIKQEAEAEKAKKKTTTKSTKKES